MASKEIKLKVAGKVRPVKMSHKVLLDAHERFKLSGMRQLWIAIVDEQRLDVVMGLVAMSTGVELDQILDDTEPSVADAANALAEAIAPLYFGEEATQKAMKPHLVEAAK